MPIKFRCEYCRQLIGIAHSKAGSLVDCPTCGRTLRVPNKDGTVDPPPAVGLDLADDGLRRALDELADLGRDKAKPKSEPHDLPPLARDELPSDSREATRGLMVTPPVIVKPKPIVQTPRPIVPQSNAIALEPLPPMVVVNPPVPQRANSAGGHQAAAVAPVAGASPEEIVAGIAGPAPAAKVVASTVSPARPAAVGYALKWLIVASVISGLAGIGLGFGLSRVFNSGGVPVAQPGVAPHAAPDAAAEESDEVNLDVPAGKPMIKGRITTINAKKELEPDAGACLILFPAKRNGTTKLQSAGLRPNDEAKTRRQALKLLREQGGRLAITDADGNFQVELPEDTKYQLIVLSHYQGRLPDDPGPEEARQAAEENFDRPDQLVGKLAFEIAEFDYAGTGTIVWNFTFAPAIAE